MTRHNSSAVLSRFCTVVVIFLLPRPSSSSRSSLAHFFSFLFKKASITRSFLFANNAGNAAKRRLDRELACA